MSIVNFPKNPTDGQIFTVMSGLVYKYSKKQNSWKRIYGETVGLATPLSNGLMSKDDYTKLSNLKIPPVQSSITGEDCDNVFKSGIVGLYSTDGSIKIAHNLTVGSSLKAWTLGNNVAGYNFTIDLNYLISEMKKRGNYTEKIIAGDKGIKGKKGDPGENNLDTGPVGDIGEPGRNSTYNGIITSESLNFEISNKNKSRAIVDIKTEEISDTENYLVFTRANINNPDACPDSIIPKEFSSNWIVALNTGNLKLVKTNQSSFGDNAFSCMICASSVHYINIKPILDEIKNRFYKIINKIKLDNEILLESWLKTMVSVFNIQKSALCCALENCKSRVRNQDTRRYIEQSMISAAASNFKLVISSDGDDRKNTDLSAGKNCNFAETNSDNVKYGNCNKGECTVLIDLDPKVHSSSPNSGGVITRFSLPEGEYIAEIVDCCARVGPYSRTHLTKGPIPVFNNNQKKIIGKWTGRVGILFNNGSGQIGSPKTPFRNLSKFSGNNTGTVFIPNLGTYNFEAEARNAYFGLTTSFNHKGGDIFVWIPDSDNNLKNNDGKISVCVKSSSCLGLQATSDLTANVDRIYAYRNRISRDTLLGIIYPFEGDVSAFDNYGLSGGIANLVNGPDLEKFVAKLFIYNGSDGLSTFLVNHDGSSYTDSIESTFYVESNNPKIAISDNNGELTEIYTNKVKTYKGSWSIIDDTAGGAISLRDSTEKWIVTLDPTNFNQMKSFRIVDGTGRQDIIIAESDSGIGEMVDINFDDKQSLISIYTDNNLSSLLGGPYAMHIANATDGQDMEFYRSYSSFDIDGDLSNDIVDDLIVIAKANKSTDLKVSIISNSSTFEWPYKNLEIRSDFSEFNYGQPTSSSGRAFRLDGISKLTLNLSRVKTGDPVLLISQIKVKLRSGEYVILENFDYTVNIPFGSYWRSFGYTPRETSERQHSGGDGGTSSVNNIYNDSLRVLNFTNSQIAAQPQIGVSGYAVAGYAPFGPLPLSTESNYSLLPSIDCEGKQARTLFKPGKSKHTLCKRIFVPQGISSITFYVIFDDNLEFASINNTLIPNTHQHFSSCPRKVGPFTIPLNLIEFNDYNVFNLHIDHRHRGTGYADISIVGINNDLDGSLRASWTVNASTEPLNVLTRLVLTPIPPDGGCSFFYTKVQWYLRGHRIGAACSFFVEVDGIGWIVIKRSIGIDTSCGGGESVNNLCIPMMIDSGRGHPSIAWQSIDGIEGIGVPNSGHVSFIVDDDLQAKIFDKINSGEVSNIVGDLNSHETILFPAI